MVRYLFVAGFYVAAVLAAPAPGQGAVAAPAGWRDDSPSGSLFGWARPNHNKPDSAADDVQAGPPASLFAPLSTWDWGSLFGGGSRGDISGKGAGSPQAAAPEVGLQPASSRGWGSLFGGGSRGESGGGGLFSGWGKPKPASSGSSSFGSGWLKPPSSKPQPPQPPVAPQEASKPIPAQPEVVTPAVEAQPVPAVAEKPEPRPAPKSESKPVPAQPEAVAPAVEAQPVPAVAEKPEPRPAPKPESKPIPEVAAVESQVNGDQKQVCGPRTYRKTSNIENVRQKLWHPAVGSKWQIILDGVPDTKGPMEPRDATIWDIDAWDAKASDICEAKKKGKKVICYFSAGTSETWRDDNHLIAPYNIGKICADTEVKPGTTCKNFWKGEMWIDIRNPVAWDVMKGRIKMAADKGCDAIDPDNMDIYDNEVLSTNATYGPLGKNVKFSENDSVKYLKFMADEAAKYGMSIGLKNSLSIIPKVKSFVQFAVNEECAKIKECTEYKDLLAVKKPIFHIEYTGTQGGSNQATTKTTYKDPASATKRYCNPLREAVSRFSTIIKAGETLGNQYLYCDGKPAGFTKMAFYVNKDKKGKGKANFVEAQDGRKEDGEAMESANERVVNSTSTTPTSIEKRRAPIKRRHHRWAELERNPDWVE